MVRQNPNKDYVARMRQAIEDNEGYCPCVLNKSEDTICPCKVFRETMECHCGLYIKE